MSARNVSTAFALLTIFLVVVSAQLEASTEETPKNYTQDFTYYLNRLFLRYGNGVQMPFESFEHFLESLGLANLQIPDHVIEDHFRKLEFQPMHLNHSHTATTSGKADLMCPCSSLAEFVGLLKQSSSAVDDSLKSSRNRRSPTPKPKCLSANEMLQLSRVKKHVVTKQDFFQLCPVLLYQLDVNACDSMTRRTLSLTHTGRTGRSNDEPEPQYDHDKPKKSLPPVRTWLIAFAAVIVTSIISLAGLAIVPIIGTRYYNHLLLFLIGLGVGTLTGDAVLHLIPHALLGHADEERPEPQTATTSFAPTNSSGIWLMTSTESSLRKPISALKDKDQAIQVLLKSTAILAGMYFFYIVERVMSHLQQDRSAKRKPRRESADENAIQVELLPVEADETAAPPGHSHSHESLNASHGHSHGDHGHSHEVPKSISSVAWMVIMGDGLHNFSDGIAIGAAFASSMAMGFSTTVAVLCHELPHELGDFAVLLKAGMSFKMAAFYNLLSALVSLIGVAIGCGIGGVSDATSWIFLVAAGMFLYIALCDLLPEASMEKSEEAHSIFHTTLLNFGILLGILSMFLIAFFESDLMDWVQNMTQ